MTSSRVIPWIVCIAATWPFSACPAEEPYDLVLLGGKIVDGTGNPWFYGDVALRGARIALVGRLAARAARHAIDCRGLVVAPGFIDMHSHSDMLLLEDGDAQSKIRQGVTTEVLGEGSSAGPRQGKLSARSVKLRGKTLQWTTLGEYLDTLEREGIATNVVSYVGLGTIWRCVMGDSFERPTPEEITTMKALVTEAMEDGAFGLSSMLAAPPGMLATTDDIVELCRVVRRHGGIFSSHIRNEGTEVFAAVKEAIEIGERAGVTVDIIHMKIADQRLWGRMNELIALVENARERGVNVQANVYPYTRGNNNLVSIIPPWAHEGGREKLLDRLKDPVERERMKKDILAGLPGWYNHYLGVGGDWSRMLVNANLSRKNKELEGVTMDKILAIKRHGKNASGDALDVLFDFLIEENGSISTIYAHHTEKDMNVVLKQPWCSIGSDGSAYATDGPLRRGKPHPRNFGTFPRVLGVYVRERRLLRLENAVRKMTSLNAAKLGLRDRGLLRSGNFADLTVFDPQRVVDRATYLDPFQYNVGIHHVIINGKLVLHNGTHTGARPGRALRRGR